MLHACHELVQFHGDSEITKPGKRVFRPSRYPLDISRLQPIFFARVLAPMPYVNPYTNCFTSFLVASVICHERGRGLIKVSKHDLETLCFICHWILLWKSFMRRHLTALSDSMLAFFLLFCPMLSENADSNTCS